MISEMYFKWFSKAFKSLVSELNKINFNDDPENIAREIVKKREKLKVFKVMYRFEKFLHDFLGKVGKGGIFLKKIDPKKLVPELIFDVSDVIGMIDDINDFVFLVQYSIILSEFYFLMKAYKEYNLEIPDEVKRDFREMMEEIKIEGKITRVKDRVIFFETIEDDEFERYFKMKKDDVKNLYLKLCDFVLDLDAKIKEMLG